MRHVGYRERFTADDVADATRRKHIFRAMAKDLLAAKREGALTDAPGAIMRLMELAYKAGMEAAPTHSDNGPAARGESAFTDLDLPSSSRDRIAYLRLCLFGEFKVGSATRLPAETSVFAFKSPKVAGFPSTISRDEWMTVRRDNSCGNKSFQPLIKAGIYKTIDGAMQGGWEVAFLTERGYELLRTGSTCREDDFEPGSTSTYAEYQRIALKKGTWPTTLINSAVALGIMKPPPEPESKPSRTFVRKDPSKDADGNPTNANGPKI